VSPSKKKKRNSEQNINVRAAFIHVIGDLIQSIGVVIAGYIIWFKVGWQDVGLSRDYHCGHHHRCMQLYDSLQCNL